MKLFWTKIVICHKNNFSEKFQEQMCINDNHHFVLLFVFVFGYLIFGIEK